MTSELHNLAGQLHWIAPNAPKDAVRSETRSRWGLGEQPPSEVALSPNWWILTGVFMCATVIMLACPSEQLVRRPQHSFL